MKKGLWIVYYQKIFDIKIPIHAAYLIWNFTKNTWQVRFPGLICLVKKGSKPKQILLNKIYGRLQFKLVHEGFFRQNVKMGLKKYVIVHKNLTSHLDLELLLRLVFCKNYFSIQETCFLIKYYFLMGFGV